MARRFRIPLIADIVTVEDADEARVLVADRRLDRVPAEGPLLNRLIVGRIRRLLALESGPFPTMMTRTDPNRAAAQQALAQRLSAAAARVAETPEADTAPVVDYIRGQGSSDVAAVALQQLVGQLFAADYRADQKSWRAAGTFDRAVSSRNPLKWLLTALTGRAAKARGHLAMRIDGDAAGVHATGIAIHNMVTMIERLRGYYIDAAMRARLDGPAAAAAAFAAPPAILRQATRPADTIAGAVKPGTLVMLRLRRAADQHMDPALALLEGEWSACPAGPWLRAIFAEIWTRALSEGKAP